MDYQGDGEKEDPKTWGVHRPGYGQRMADHLSEAVRLGVTDPERVGIGGHSHGGLMTATLLAHSDLFRAGIARSGVYNHTTRPFGWQSERRIGSSGALLEAAYKDLSP